MSHRIANPYYKESERYKLIIYSGIGIGTECDCNIESATFYLKSGADLNNPFSLSKNSSGSIVTDYDFFEGQIITVKLYSDKDDNYYGDIGTFYVVSKSGNEFKKYNLISYENSVNLTQDVLEKKISIQDGFFPETKGHVMEYKRIITLILSSLSVPSEGLIPDVTYEVNYRSDLSDFNQYTLGGFLDITNAASCISQIKRVDIGEYIPPLILNNSYEDGTDTDFGSYGIQLFGISVNMVSSLSSTGIYEGNLEFVYEEDNLLQEKITIYLSLDENDVLNAYYTRDDTIIKYALVDNIMTTSVVSSMPEGNSYVFDFPFSIGNDTYTSDVNTNEFISDLLHNQNFNEFLKEFKDLNLASRKMKIPFHPSFLPSFNRKILGGIFSVYDYDGLDSNITSDLIDITDEQYSDLLDSKAFDIVVNEINIYYDGGMYMEISSGSAFDGGKSISSTSTASNVNISSQSGGIANFGDLYVEIANLKKLVAETNENYVEKEYFAQLLASIFENAKLDGAIIKDSTIKGSSIEESIFKDGKIQGSAIDGSTFTNGSISGTAIDGSTFTDGQISGSKIDSSTLTNIPYASMDEAFVNDLVSDSVFADELKAEVATFGYLDAQMANIDFANLNKANIGQLFANVGLLSSATITDGHVTGYLDSVEVNANKITAGTLAVDRLLIKDASGNYKMATYDESGNIVTTTINGSVITDRTITADHLVAGTITANEINMTDLVGNSAFINAISSNVITVTKQPYYTVSETPTLTNYPANTFYSHRLYKDGIKFGLPFAENMFSSHLGSKAYDNDGHSWVFDKDSEGNFYWADTSYSLETQLKNLTKTVEGVTYIDGGHIYTNSIKADSIDTKNLTVENLVTSYAEFRPNGNNFIYQNDDAFPFIICKSKKEKDIGLLFSSTGIILQGSISVDDHVTIQGQDGIYYFGSLNNKPKIYIGRSVTPIEEIHSSVIYEGGSELSEKYATKAELRALGINI